MKTLLFLFFTCANAMAFAQVNFVKNPSFEEYTKCPDDINRMSYARYWSCAVDTVGVPYYAPEYYTGSCTPPDLNLAIPQSTRFYQYPHAGNAMVGAVFYYDKTLPVPGGVTSKWRDYFQGHFYFPLDGGKTYCISFWVNMAEASGYAHNKIGAYVDNGEINHRDTPGVEILDVVPQVSATKVIDDTMHWTKIEGSFVATGNETHITLGNFFPNAAITTVSNTWGAYDQYSYYLFDDIAVIPVDLKANAGKDSHAEPGKPVQIGRVGDTTARGLDCKWFHKGALIDSGAMINVNGAAIVGTVDTYVVVQTICGLSKTDTVTVTTVPVGFQEYNADRFISVYPNPSNGNITVTHSGVQAMELLRVFDLSGRIVDTRKLSPVNEKVVIRLDLSPGNYFLELSDKEGSVWRERVTIE